MDQRLEPLVGSCGISGNIFGDLFTGKDSTSTHSSAHLQSVLSASVINALDLESSVPGPGFRSSMTPTLMHPGWDAGP